MANIFQFAPKPPAKLGFERVKRRKKKSSSEKEQLDLFSHGSARVFQLSQDLTIFEQALILDERGDQRAAEVYAKAIAAGDSVADAYCNLGILESKAGQTAKAFDCFTQALKHDPRHFESHYNLANLYFELGNLVLARAHYELAAEVEPAFPNVYFNLGIVHALNEQYAAAIAALRTFKQLVPDNESDRADELLAVLEHITEANRASSNSH
jgi:Flp pilus assembly protein TadD